MGIGLQGSLVVNIVSDPICPDPICPENAPASGVDTQEDLDFVRGVFKV